MADTENTKPEDSQESRKITAGENYFEYVKGNVYRTVHIHHALPSPMNKFVADLSGSQRFLVLFLTLSLIETLLAFWTGGAIATIILTIAIPALLWFSQKIWLSEGYGKTSIRRVLSGIVVLIAASFSLWNPLVGSFLLNPIFQALKGRVSGLEHYQLPLGTPSMEILFIVLTGFFLVNYFFIRDTSAMKAHPTPIEKEFPEKGYKQRLKSFCGVLLDDLNKIDRETNWSAEYFTPLDAEVEMQSGNKRLKKVTNLLTAIRSDRKSRVFLVLGDPGSGKSVALRKLCRDLLEEVDKTGKVPLYINLREWEIEEEWTEENPPTTQQLYDFLLKNLKERGDVFANEFLDRYFKPMFDYGRFFIVLDSFDEIPAVLDADASSWLIDKLSDVIYKFLAGAHESRGILASRIFRKPTHNFQTKTTLEIRPFTEVKITQTFQKSMLQDSEQLTKLLFKEREEFVPIARNPFTAALIVSYAKEHNNTLPQTQAELYSDYINRRLLMCQDRIKKKNLTAEGIIQRAEDIADLMFTTPEFGLEIPLEELKERLSQYFVEDEIAILKYGRLGRLGGGEEHRFSFAHRRFQEFFVAKRLLEKPEELSLEAIPTDSRWRDALVLYCEVAADREARKIAEFCWSEIRKIADENLNMSDPQYLRAIHSLRFLKDTFRARLDCLSSFRDQLADFIDRQIENSNLLSIKLAVEALGLLQKERIDLAIIKALNIGNTWISETAFKACRNLPRLSSELEENLKIYLLNQPELEIFQRRKELLFSLSLSDSFTSLYTFCKYRTIWIFPIILGLLGIFFPFFVTDPFFSIVAILLMVVVLKFEKTWVKAISYISTKYTKSPNNRKLRKIFSSNPFSWVKSMAKAPEKGLPLWLAFIVFVVISVGVKVYTYSHHLLSNFIIFLPLWLGILLIIPWFSLPFLFNLSEKKRDRKLFSFTIIAIITGGVIGILSSLFESFEEYRDVMSSWRIWLEGFFGKSLMIFFLSSILILILLWIGPGVILPLINNLKDFLFWDAKMLKRLFNIANISREDIAEQFNKFKTPWGRLRYVQFLQRENMKFEGGWPDGKIPNIDADEASTLLAQLEEKWLRLDR